MTKENKPGGVERRDLFALCDTRIEAAGVMRCCLATVALEFEGVITDDGFKDQLVRIGQKSKCKHCNEEFTLVESKPHPKWKPGWQLSEANAGDDGPLPERNSEND